MKYLEYSDTPEKYIEKNIWYIDNERWVDFFTWCPPIILEKVVEILYESGVNIPDFENAFIEFYFKDYYDYTLVPAGIDARDFKIYLDVKESRGCDLQDKVLVKNIYDAMNFIKHNFSRKISYRLLDFSNVNKISWMPVKTTAGNAYVSSYWLSTQNYGKAFVLGHDTCR